MLDVTEILQLFILVSCGKWINVHQRSKQIHAEMEKKEEDIYQFDPERTHQGLALVISNFTEGGRKREGSEADLKYMKKTFKRLGFKVDCHENVKGSEIVSLLNKCKYFSVTS